MTDWTYRCLIVPDAQVDYARALSEAVAGAAGAGMWTTPLSASGLLPATHWISAGLISAEFAALLPLTTFPPDAEPINTPGNPEMVAQLATTNGYSTTTEQVQALFDASDITEEEAQQAMSRLGLQMAAEDTRIDINTATAEVLDTLFGIGDVRTAQIVEGRPWASVDGLAEIDGISAGMVEDWRSLIKV